MKRLTKLLVPVFMFAFLVAFCALPVKAEGNVIFIKDGATGDGSSADSALKPTTGNYDANNPQPELYKDAALYQAMEKLMEAGGGTIVVCGPYTLDDSNCKSIGGSSADFIMDPTTYMPDVTITYTSVWDGVDYRETAGAEIILDQRAHLTFPTGTVLENINVRGTQANEVHFVCAGINPITLAQGTNFIPWEEGNLETAPTLLGSFRNNRDGLKEGNTSITIDIGDENAVGRIFGQCNGGTGRHIGDANITIKSGTIWSVFGDSPCHEQVPIEGNVTINLEGGIFTGIIGGVWTGFVGDGDRAVNINITGGDFTNCPIIMGYSPNSLTANVPNSAVVDMTGASAEVAEAAYAVCDGTITEVKLPEGLSFEASAEDAENAETETTGGAAEENTEDGGVNVALIVVIAVIVVAVIVVAVVLKKKKSA